MIRINLLPHREQKRERRKRDFNGQLVISAIVGGGIVFLGGMFINHEIKNQNARNKLIRSAGGPAARGVGAAPGGGVHEHQADVELAVG